MPEGSRRGSVVKKVVVTVLIVGALLWGGVLWRQEEQEADKQASAQVSKAMAENLAAITPACKAVQKAIDDPSYSSDKLRAGGAENQAPFIGGGC